MKTTESIQRGLLALAAIAATCLAAGCAATRFTSPERLSETRPSDRLVHSYYVESARGTIVLAHDQLTHAVSPGASEINRLLRARYPRVFNKEAGAVPLHVEYSGTVAAIGAESHETNPLFIPFWWRYSTGGKLAVAIALDNRGKRKLARVPYRKSRTEAVLFWPLIVPGAQDWPVVWGVHPAASKMEPVFADLVAAGVVKALNRMDEGELALLASEAYQTPERRRLTEWLAAGPGITVSVDADGRTFVESAREFVPVEVDMAAWRAVPDIVSQHYDASSRRGMVEADSAGADAGRTIDYLVGRVIPAICRTKGVVFNPEDEPPGGALFRVLGVSQEERNGKERFRIEFESVE